MDIVNIVFEFRSAFEVFFDNGKSIRVLGEMMAVPEFYADPPISSIKKFEAPYQNEEITEDIRQEIVNKIIKYSRENGNPPTLVYFD